MQCTRIYKKGTLIKNSIAVPSIRVAVLDEVPSERNVEGKRKNTFSISALCYDVAFGLSHFIYMMAFSMDHGPTVCLNHGTLWSQEKFKTFLMSEKHSKTLKRFSSTLDCAIQDMQSAGVAAVAADTTAIVRHNCTHTSRASWSRKFLKT